MKILHVANFSWFFAKHKRADHAGRFYATDRKITNGLIRNGHCVWDFSYRDIARHLPRVRLGKQWGAAAMNEYLLELAAAMRPDIVLLGHSEVVSPQTLRAIRQQHPHCKIGQWWMDSFANRPKDISHLRAKHEFIDAFFATSAPSYYAPLLPSDSPPRFYYFPNMVDSSIEAARSFRQPSHEFDVFFAGMDNPARAKLLQAIAAQEPPPRCGFFGFGAHPYLGGSELHNTIGRSKIGINLSQLTQMPLYSSDRLAQLAGNGCMVITPRTPQMTRLFAEDEVVYYDDAKHLLQQVAAYLQDDNAWRQVAERGHQRAHRCYNEKRVTKFMLEAITESQWSEDYDWL